MGQPAFFDLDEHYQRLSDNGDPLVKFAALIDIEAFRLKLATALKRSDGSKGARPPYDPVLERFRAALNRAGGVHAKLLG
ncbi:hypothetical protein [Methylobacterium flocculans]|uniref:hypothetical protein n=1 Tax=Methylobacterium flocculans TaxID=2984843 RepID=UPI0021F3A8FB|nr:hypothetical protein [Methylobacterium sp. FF17]